jgi:hypothetical protein
MGSTSGEGEGLGAKAMAALRPILAVQPSASFSQRDDQISESGARRQYPL